MSTVTNFDEAITQLKTKYPHRSGDIDFRVEHLPEAVGSIAWQEQYLWIANAIEREETAQPAFKGKSLPRRRLKKRTKSR